MKCLALNENNDLFIENGKLGIYSDKEAIAQTAVNIVCTVNGEVVLNQTRGIPYFEILFNNKPNTALFRNYVLNLLDQVPEINKVTGMKIIKDKNLLKYSLDLDTIWGRVEANG